jgi:hypothetical protein
MTMIHNDPAPLDFVTRSFERLLSLVGIGLIALSLIGLFASPLSAQVETVDPDAGLNMPIDGDLAPLPSTNDVPELPSTDAAPAAPTWSQPGGPIIEGDTNEQPTPPAATPQGTQDFGTDVPSNAAPSNPDSTTYREDDLIGAAEGVFGAGAKGVAELIRGLLAEQGEPNGYIVGREAGGAFVVGARYGSGTLFHKVEGERTVYWTGPSIGFDAGANAGSTFVLVYNLYDSEELYKRFPAGEGQAYLVGGMTVSYLRRGDVVLIPIRVGAGLRLGVNAGYMRFSKKQRWLPF